MSRIPLEADVLLWNDDLQQATFSYNFVFIFDHETKQIQEASVRLMEMFGYNKSDIKGLTDQSV